jgi:prenylcysteine oxidase/farnesylcysteine lyase
MLFAGLLLAAFCLLSAGAESPELRIAIIGSGIGGASTASFLRDALGNGPELTVFEASDRVGGRVREIEVAGSQMEAGGAAVHSLNEYMVSFARKLNLDLDFGDDGNDDSSGQIGVWDGRNFLIRTSTAPGWLGDAETLIRAAVRYGVRSPLRLRSLVKKTQSAWQDVYRRQLAGEAFETPLALFRALGLAAECGADAAKFLEEEHEIDSRLVEEIVAGISRVNYNQGDLNAFADMVSLSGAGLAGGALGSVRGGNARVMEGLLRTSGADVRLKTKVKEVKSLTPASQNLSRPAQFRVIVESELHGEEALDFDAVVIAAPLESAELSLEGFDSSLSPGAAVRREYQTTHVTFVEAKGLSPEFFGNKDPSARRFRDEGVAAMSTVMTTETPENSFSSVAVHGAASGAEGGRIYKIFSRQKTTDSLVASMFSEVNEASTTRLQWQAYPKLKPAMMRDEALSPPFRLASRLWYVNAMESAVSCMECEAVGARNVANGLVRELRGGVISTGHANKSQL